MRNLDFLPLVSCDFDLQNGPTDIAIFRAAARACGWSEAEADSAICDAIDTCANLNDVGQFLCSYTTGWETFLVDAPRKQPKARTR